MEKCMVEGDSDCRIVMSYNNQCAAIAVPSSQKGGAYVARAASEEEALNNAIEKCSDTGGGQCIKYYSECSEPVFIPY